MLQNDSSIALKQCQALYSVTPRFLSFDSACASANQAISPGGSVSELTFSFFNCSPVPQEPQVSVLPDVSDSSGYTLIEQAARDFCGWLTVTAYAVARSAVRAFRRIICEAKAFFNRRIQVLQGGLQL